MSSTPQQLNGQRRAALGFWLLVALLALVAAGKEILHDTLDPDLFWHLRVAQQLRADGIGPIVDRISFASVRQPWTPYSWLAELFMEWTWRTLGWRGAVAIAAISSSVVVVLIALCCIEMAGKDRRLNCAIATAFGAVLSLSFLSFRPVTFAIVLLGVGAWLLLRDRREPSRRVWLIVPIMTLITNLHLSAVMVPLWLACLLAGAVRERRNVKRYAILLAASALACLATPMLPGAARAAWFYQSRDVMVASRVIAEMQPFWSGYAGLVTAIVLIAFAMSIFTNPRPLRVGERLWVLAAGLMMLRLGRFAPMFAYIAAPALAITMPRLGDRALARPIVITILAVVSALGAVRIVWEFPPSAQSLDEWLSRRKAAAYPVQAAEFAERNVERRSGRVITEFDWGGYVAWRLGDSWQVLLDGRTQLYTPEFWQATYLGDSMDVVPILRDAHADAAILPAHMSRFRAALDSLGWRSVYGDDVAEVLLPPLP